MSESEVIGLVCGYPCRSLSSQNTDPKSFLDGKSTTGMGFRSLMGYVASSENLRFCLVENVKGMMQIRHKFSGECPRDIQAKWFEKYGFVEAFALLLNSLTYGLAQSRTRTWMLYVKKGAFRCLAPLGLTFEVLECLWSHPVIISFS